MPLNWISISGGKRPPRPQKQPHAPRLMASESGCFFGTPSSDERFLRFSLTPPKKIRRKESGVFHRISTAEALTEVDGKNKI